MNTITHNSILIVDDTPNNIRVLFDILHGAGFKVSVVKSGELALEKASFIQPDLILLDVMMPGIDGFETCQRLKADQATKDIPIIFMTALSEVENKVKGLQLGAVDYITKPIQIQEVLARVNVHLTLRNTQFQLFNEVIERKQVETQVQQTLKELQQTQTQLIQSEKMSSLGQLVAGIAHEINNPVNFIYGNLTHAKDYTQDLLRLLQVYQQYYPNPVSEVQFEIEAIDLDFLVKDLSNLLDSMKIGAERIRQIVLSLRVFSRLDEAEIKAVDIHEGIDSTLMILAHRLKGKFDRCEIQVIKEYGDLPLVECYAGQLNQVFMNILSNAIDALEEGNRKNDQEDAQTQIKRDADLDISISRNSGFIRPEEENSSLFESSNFSSGVSVCRPVCFSPPPLQQFATPQICIRTQLEENQVKIYITDNGPGIPEQVKHRMFEPFYTTKPIGVGMGMGLAISYQIVTQQHGGTLECMSHPGQGTEFAIAIPLTLSRL